MTRSWNISQNIKYLNSIKKKSLPLSIESLSLKDRFNEWQEKQQAGRENPGINELAGNIIPGTSYFEVEFPFHENKKIRREDTAFRRGGRNRF